MAKKARIEDIDSDAVINSFRMDDTSIPPQARSTDGSVQAAYGILQFINSLINNKNIMKRKMNDSQADSLQTRKSERTAARAAKCTTGCGQGTDGGVFRKGKDGVKPISTFLQASEIKTRQCIYISREIHEKVAIVASRMGNGLSIGKFVDNILRDHFRQYGAQYTEQIENAKKVRL